MFQAKMFYFLVGILVLVCTTENNVDGLGIERSAVCLIQRIAQYNHIDATYTKVSFEQRNGTIHSECKLLLGTEEYTSNSTSFPNAKEKVARQAYTKTRYQRPEIRNRTCLNHTPTNKSDISILEEYANAIDATVVSYEEIQQNSKCTFQCFLT